MDLSREELLSYTGQKPIATSSSSLVRRDIAALAVEEMEFGRESLAGDGPCWAVKAE